MSGFSSEQTITIPGWAQGRPDLGQGGYTSAQFAHALGRPVRIDLRAPIPLDTAMQITKEVPVVQGRSGADDGPDRWHLRNGDTTIMTATDRATAPEIVTTSAVAFSDAADARTRFPVTPEAHNARLCRSCGFGDLTMQVWPGSLGDGSGRVASDWTPPDWAGNSEGVVDDALVWMALDCTCGFYVGHHPEPRSAVTVQFAVDILSPILVGEEYAIVGHDGRWRSQDWPGGWDGRKRGAGSCVFDRDGNIVAQSESFWVSIPDAASE